MKSEFVFLPGEVIGKDLREYYNIQNCEVNDFRWKMKAFANGKAQSRKKRLEGSWQDRIAYQVWPLTAKKQISSAELQFVVKTLRNFEKLSPLITLKN